MDCAAEETMVRIKLEGLDSIRALDFNIPSRRLTIIHEGGLSAIRESIDSLDFSASLESTETLASEAVIESDKVQSGLLWKVLVINFSFFLIEIVTGIISRSMGLVADSLDMLADALVYGLSLFAVGGTIARKKGIAGISGYFQLFLALIGLIEVVRRFIEYEKVPDFKMMMFVSVFALIGNTFCLYLLQKSKSREAHMRASMIFTSNDVIINMGVITAGALVFLLDSKYPDLVIGAIVFIVVTRGALSILRLSK